MKNLEKFFPIGIVVMLKNGKNGVIINLYGVFSTDNVYSSGKKISRKREIFQYGRYLYRVLLILILFVFLITKTLKRFNIWDGF